MKNVLLIKEIYKQAFRDLGSQFAKSYVRTFSWFAFAAYLIVLYAFIFRVSTGFAFD